MLDQIKRQQFEGKTDQIKYGKYIYGKCIYTSISLNSNKFYEPLSIRRLWLFNLQKEDKAICNKPKIWHDTQKHSIINFILLQPCTPRQEVEQRSAECGSQRLSTYARTRHQIIGFVDQFFHNKEFPFIVG